MRKYTLLILVTVIGLSGIAYAAPTLIYQKTILPEIDSTYNLGNNTNAWLQITTDELCLTADSCKTAWPTAGSAGGWATTSEQYFWNATTTWAGFEDQFNTFLNNVTELTLDYVTSTQKLVIGSTNPINDAVLFVTGDGYIDGNATTTGSMNVGGDMSVTGNQSITGELTVTGNIPNRYEEEIKTCDGATTSFTTSNGIATNTEQILWNNKYLTKDTDYTIKASNDGFDLTGLLSTYPCVSGDELLINYRRP